MTSVEDAFWHTYDFLETCAKKGITLNPKKFKFCRREVEFVGYNVGWTNRRTIISHKVIQHASKTNNNRHTFMVWPGEPAGTVPGHGTSSGPIQGPTQEKQHKTGLLG